MPRPISWQPRLSEIQRQVNDSPRDPYHRADLERLFRVKRRAAQILIETMPRQTVGSSTVIERVDLLEFLGRAIDAEDLGKMLADLRAAPPKPKRRKLRTFVPRDFEPGNLHTVSRGVFMRRGRIELLYDNLEELVSLLHQLSTVVESPEFERRYCPLPPPPKDLGRSDEMALLEAELLELEEDYAAAKRFGLEN